MWNIYWELYVLTLFRSQSLSLSLSVPPTLSLCPSHPLSLSLFLSFSIPLSIYPLLSLSSRSFSVCPSHPLSLSSSLSLSLYLYTPFSLSPLALFLCLSVSLLSLCFILWQLFDLIIWFIHPPFVISLHTDVHPFVISAVCAWIFLVMGCKEVPTAALMVVCPFV